MSVIKKIRSNLNTENSKSLAHTFMSSQFYYASIIWVFSGKMLIPKMH